MEIPIGSVGDVSAISGNAFAPDDRVWSFLYRNDEGLIDRVDILESEVGELSIGGSLICKWCQTIREKSASEAEERRAALQSADDVFLSLFENDEELEADAVESRDRLKFFLGLQLQRKRVLKPLGGRRFRHMPSKREFTLPEMEISAELLAKFNQEISLMKGSPA